MTARALLWILLAAWQLHGAAVRKMEVLTAGPARGKRLELRVHLAARYTSAFDPEDVRRSGAEWQEARPEIDPREIVIL